MIYGFVEIIIYLVESLWSGICVVFFIDVVLLLWFMIKMLLDVLINIDLIFFLKFLSLNFVGRVICWFEGINIVLFIWIFK